MSLSAGYATTRSSGSQLVGQILRRCDGWLLLFAGLIILASLPTIYSATLRSGGGGNWYFVNRQLIWLGIGLVGMVLVNTLDHHEFPELTRWVYWLSVAGLVAVLLMGSVRNGAKSWFGFGAFSIQPSELAKIAMVLAFARFYGVDEADGSDIKDIIRSAALIGLPTLLILLQPDLGTALSFLTLWLVLLWWGGAKPWQILLIVMLGLLAATLAWHLDLLHDYQKARIEVLFNPNADPRGAGYNLRQSLIAVGSGGMWGKGWLQGTQTHLRFLPERHTDFIFAVLAEERGWVGCIVLLVLFVLLFQRGWMIVAGADSPYGRALAVGCLTILMFHVVFNLGMVLGLLPITGIPLSFFSYGGSHLLTCLLLLGILQNVATHRRGGINY